MKFKRKKEAELAKMTPEERDQYAIDLAEAEKAERAEELETMKANILKELKANGADEEELKSMKTQLEELTEFVSVQKEKAQGLAMPASFNSLLEKALTEALPMLKEMKNGDHKDKDGKAVLTLEIKAAVPVLTTAIANAAGVVTPDSFVYQQVNGYASDIRADQYIINFLSNGTTDKASMPYMDKLPNEGAMAVTAEGALKPLISFSFKLRYSEAQKIAGRVKVSEESLDDINQLMTIINNELRFEHDIAEQTAIFVKINAIAAAFVAGGMAGSTTAPSNYDALRAAIYMIKIVSKGRFVPNAVLAKSVDIYNMGATKTTYNQYVLPPFVLPDGSKIMGVQIVEVNDSTIADGAFIVGDFRKLHRDVYKGFTIRMGQGIQGSATAANIQSDFETNMWTIIGESRVHLWVYENEKPAFVKSTYAAVKTAIAAS